MAVRASRLACVAGALAVACALLAPPSASATSPTAPELARPAFAPGELLVQYRSGVDAGRRSAIRASQRATLGRRLGLPRTELVRLPAGTPVGRAARAFEARPGVRYAEPNFYRYLQRTPNDPAFPELWGLENTGRVIRSRTGTPGADIAATGAWETTTGSAAVTVAVIDDGIDYAHPDLASNIWRNPGETGAGKETNGIDDDDNGRVDDWRGWDFVGNDNDPAPVGGDSDHGTHVAGTIGAKGDNGVGVVGVNWGVGLMPARVFDHRGRTTISLLVAAYGYASRVGAEVVNGSYSGSGFSATERNAIAAASQTLFAVAAGNESANNDAFPAYPCNYSVANIVCVAATDQTDRLASFSNYGRASVDLAAPGVNILSTIRSSSYAYFNGTSMAAPHVAGAAALLWADDPIASPTEVRTRLLGSVDPLASLTDKVASGGRLDVERALALDVSDTEPTAGDPVSSAGADTTAPTTTITKRPPRRTKRRSARFRFNASEPASFRCRLDRRRWRPCSSPKRYRNLPVGRHVFRVRAADAVGNVEATPEKRAWRVKR